MKFSNGDFVVGNESSDYKYMVTNSDTVCKIVSMAADCDVMIIKPVKRVSGRTPFSDYFTRSEFEVETKFFKPYDENDYKVDLI